MACCGPLIGLSFSCFLLFSGLFWPGPFFPNFRLWIPKRCMVFLVFWDSIPKRCLPQKRCKGVHCVDVGESFPTQILIPTHIFDTAGKSPAKFACSPRTDPPGGLCLVFAAHVWGDATIGMLILLSRRLRLRSRPREEAPYIPEETIANEKEKST